MAVLAPLLLTLALAASAQEEPGAPAQKAREAVLALPAEARVELKKLWRAYSKLVSDRLEKGWGYGVISEAVIEGRDEPFQPARLVEDALKARRAQVAELEKKVRDPGPRESLRRLREQLEGKRLEVKELERKSRREKGLCRDWSDLIWFELTKKEYEHWEVKEETRRARPYHTSAVVCSPQEDPVVCLALDPWEDGRATVVSFGTWDENGFGGRLPAKFFIHELPDEEP